MNAPLLEVRRLTKSFGRLRVTNDVSFVLEKGARHALIGPNGAGKTTLVGLLSGTLQPDSGNVLIEGVDVTKESPVKRVRRGLGRTFQITNLFAGLTVLENLYLALSERLGVSGGMFQPASGRRDVLAEAYGILDLLGLTDVAMRTISSIAYGEQRLIEIALALCLQPKILLLDEPAAGIPGKEMSRVIGAIAKLPAETAILLIEHDMAIVRQVATTASVLVTGSILESGATAAVLQSEQVKAVYLGRGRHA